MLVALHATGCRTTLRDAQFRCDPGDPATCPEGWSCQRRAGHDGYRCYRTYSPDYCGNGVVTSGEVCDGSDLGGRSCRDEGFWGGRLGCDPDCRPVTTDCRRMVELQAGSASTYGVDDRGDLWVWGWWVHGGIPSSRPQRVPSTLPVRKVTGSPSSHACLLDESGAVWCWGINNRGAVGRQVSGYYPVPVPVDEGRSYLAVAAGMDFTCAVAVDGTARCWGRNDVGQLGNGTEATESYVPRAVAQTIGGWVDIAAGRGHACALDGAGGLWCWGFAGNGRLGVDLGDQQFSRVPLSVPVASAAPLTGLTLGASHSCALDAEGVAWCWGSCVHGECGNGSADATVMAPTPVADAHRFTGLGAGLHHTCGVDEGGALWCWGYLDDGSGTLGDHLTPIRMETEDPVSHVSAGPFSTCALTTEGLPICQGVNEGGQAGLPFAAGTPEPVAGGHQFRQVDGSGNFACALDTDDRAWCWGDNAYLGLGTDVGLFMSPVPQPVAGDHRFSSLSLHHMAACGTDEDGRHWCWGVSPALFGDQVAALVPEELQLPVSMRTVYSSVEFACGIDHSGDPWCWGVNASGRLGSGSLADSPEPTPVLGCPKLTQLELGGDHACGLTTAGEIWCWGANDMGQLGDGTFTSRGLAAPVTADASFVQLSVSKVIQTPYKGHACALTSEAQIYCWGSNFWGQLGTGDIETHNVPTPVLGADKFAQVGVGFDHTCAVTVDDELRCWGSNWYYQHSPAPEGQVDTRYVVPVPVSLPALVDKIGLGQSLSCAIGQDGTTWCWGYDGQGQLGTYNHAPRFNALPSAGVLGGQP